MAKAWFSWRRTLRWSMGLVVLAVVGTACVAPKEAAGENAESAAILSRSGTDGAPRSSTGRVDPSVRATIPAHPSVTQTATSAATPTAITSIALATTTLSAPLSSLLHDGTEDEYTFAPPLPGQTPAITAGEALTSAEGTALDNWPGAHHSVQVVLTRLTRCFEANCETNGSTGEFKNRLVWIVQILDVQMFYDGPSTYHGPAYAIGTTQMVIDATTGEGVETRDWGQPAVNATLTR